MKTIFLSITILMLASCSHYNKREIASENKDLGLVVEDGIFLLKDEKDAIFLKNNNSKFNLKVENNNAIIEFKELKQKFTLAQLVSPDQLESTSKITVNIIKNIEEKKFKAKACTHMGCFPFPHFESTFRFLVEIQTLEGQTICYNNNVDTKKDLYTLGTCK